MSRAVVFDEYGGPEVLHVVDGPTPVPGPGQLLVRVYAAGVQPADSLFRRGVMHQFNPATFPQRLGNEYAGEVVAVGPEVTGVVIGTPVIGWVAQCAYADHVVVDPGELVVKPESMPWPEAGVLSASGQTAATALTDLGVGSGETVLIHAAAGGVGSFAVQLAVARGARVIGTASEANHDYVRSLGAVPVTYGAGLVDRIRAVAPQGVDAALDASSTVDAMRASIEVAPLQRVGVLGYRPEAADLGVRRLASRRSTEQLAGLADLYVKGALRIHVAQTFPLEQAPQAHRIIDSGHGRGKIAMTP